jgi:hypothetical protein
MTSKPLASLHNLVVLCSSVVIDRQRAVWSIRSAIIIIIRIRSCSACRCNGYCSRLRCISRTTNKMQLLQRFTWRLQAVSVDRTNCRNATVTIITWYE